MTCENCKKNNGYVDPDGNAYALCAGCLLDVIYAQILAYLKLNVAAQYECGEENENAS